MFIFFFYIHRKLDWDSLWGTTSETYQNLQNTTGVQRFDSLQNPSYFAANNVYVHDSFFNELSSDNGGSISWTAEDTSKLLVESSMFINSSATEYGGSIMMENGNCILSET